MLLISQCSFLIATPMKLENEGWNTVDELYAIVNEYYEELE